MRTLRASSSSSFLLRSSRDVGVGRRAPASTPSSAAGAVVLRGTGRAPQAVDQYFRWRRFGVTGGGGSASAMRRWPPELRAIGLWAELGGRGARATPGRRRRGPRANRPRASPRRRRTARRGRRARCASCWSRRVAQAATALMSAEPRVRGVLDGSREPAPTCTPCAWPPDPPATRRARRDARQPRAQLIHVGSEGAGPLGTLYEFARNGPHAYVARTPIVLMATAGLRSVPDRGARDAILRSCRASLARSPFLFRDAWAEVIAGSKRDCTPGSPPTTPPIRCSPGTLGMPSGSSSSEARRCRSRSRFPRMRPRRPTNSPSTSTCQP